MSDRMSTVLMLILAVLVSSSTATASDKIRVTLEFEPNLDNGKDVFEVCASCHLPEGWGNPDGTYPQLAGQHRNVLMQQLLDIRSGKRENNIMYPFVQERTIGGYQALADVVAYISTLPVSTAHGQGPWKPGTEQHDRGGEYYHRLCSGCHGNDAMGNDRAGYPRLQSQHFNYLKQQTRRIKTGLRQSAIMSPIISPLSDQTIEEILNYISYAETPDSVDSRPAAPTVEKESAQ